MADSSSFRGDRVGGRLAHERALDAYAATGRLLARILDISKEAVDAWSHQVEAARDKNAHEVAARALTSCTMHKAMAEKFIEMCCLDVGGRLVVVPGTWRDETAAFAEGMAPLASLTAARGSTGGALSSTKTNVPVFVEIGVSNAWAEFAESVSAAHRAAAGTTLDARPADELGALAARLAEESARTMWEEEGHGGRCSGPNDAALASRRAAEAGEKAAESVKKLAAGAAGRAAAMRMDAAGVWDNAAATWSKARDRAVAEGNDAVVGLVAAQAKSAEEHAARLRAV